MENHKIDLLENEYDKLLIKHEEIGHKIYRVKQLIKIEEKINKKRVRIDISENECEWYLPCDPNLDPLL